MLPCYVPGLCIYMYRLYSKNMSERHPIPLLAITRGLVRVAPQPGWVLAAVKTTAPIAVTIVTMTLLFGMQLGPLSLLGSMTAV